MPTIQTFSEYNHHRLHCALLMAQFSFSDCLVLLLTNGPVHNKLEEYLIIQEILLSPDSICIILQAAAAKLQQLIVTN